MQRKVFLLILLRGLPLPPVQVGAEVEVSPVPVRSSKGRIGGRHGDTGMVVHCGAPLLRPPQSPTGSPLGPRNLSCYRVSKTDYECSWQYDGPEDNVSHVLWCW